MQTHTARRTATALWTAHRRVLYTWADVLATLSSSRWELSCGSRRTGVGASPETSSAQEVGSGYGLTGSPVENVAASLVVRRHDGRRRS
jgi:hypothetical protein